MLFSAEVTWFSLTAVGGFEDTWLVKLIDWKDWFVGDRVIPDCDVASMAAALLFG